MQWQRDKFMEFYTAINILVSYNTLVKSSIVYIYKKLSLFNTDNIPLLLAPSNKELTNPFRA